MDITEQCVVALTWTLKDSLGEELDVLDVPVEFLLGGDDLFEVIETALRGHTVGATVNVAIEPEQGFGEFNDQLIFLEKRELFPRELEEGLTFDGTALPAGCTPEAPKDALYTVTDIYPEHVHRVREATEGEIGSGSAGTGFFRVTPIAGLSSSKDQLH